MDWTLNLKAPAWEQQWRPELDVAQAFNPRSILIPVARVEGVTWTMLAPAGGDSIIGGNGAAVILDGRFDATLPGSGSLFVSMGSAGAQQSGGTRAAEYMLLEQAIRETRKQGPVGEGSLLHAAGREALLRYLSGGRVVFQVDRASDILAVIGFARRTGCTGDRRRQRSVAGREGTDYADVPVILDPLRICPAISITWGLPRQCRTFAPRRGTYCSRAATTTTHVDTSAGGQQAHGRPEAALAAITSNPAEIFGLGAAGILQPCRHLVLWTTTRSKSPTRPGSGSLCRPVGMRSR